MPYIGNSPGTGTRNRFIYTATASQTTFSGADDNGKTLKYADSDYVDVYLNGICLVPVTDYTSTSKTSIVLTQAASLNDTLEVVAYDIATISDTVSKANGGTFNGDLGVTSASPDLTFTNSTSEDTDGGRESTITFKGKQSGGEESTLAQIQASHDGTSDDEKGDLIFRTNDGSDGSSPTEAMRIDSAQTVGIGTAAPNPTGLAIQTGGGSKGVMLARNASGSSPTNGQGFGSFAFKGIMDGTNSIAAAEASIEAIAAENHSGSTAATSLAFYTKPSGTGPGSGPSERMRIDSSGNVLVSKTATGIATVGAELKATGELVATVSGDACAFLNRTTSDGTIIDIRKANSNVGKIGSVNGDPDIFIGTIDTGFAFLDHVDAITPHSPNSNTGMDNHTDLGFGSRRWQDIFASNGTINTSDENEKQQITSLTGAEITAAKAISKLFKNYKWNSAVAAKGDNARTHTGVIAQQVRTAMSDAGLDVTKYAFWCSNTWWTKDIEVAAVEADEENGIEAADAYTYTKEYYSEDDAPDDATEHTRLAIRYAELLSFIGAATEQRLTSIEARLDALEAG